jgi:uncharacterized protein YndB with AHSA1/START domain
MPGFIARADIDIDSSPERVWDTITRRASDVSFGATVESDWTPGSRVTWKGEWQGEPFVDEGEVVEAVAPLRLVLTHASGAAGESADIHRLTYELSGRGPGTHLELSQDGNATAAAADESERNWRQHLEAIKKVAEA